MARRGSLKLTNLIKPKDRKKSSNNPEDVEEEDDSDHPTILPILRSFNRKQKKEKEHEEKFNGNIKQNKISLNLLVKALRSPPPA